MEHQETSKVWFVKHSERMLLKCISAIASIGLLAQICSSHVFVVIFKYLKEKNQHDHIDFFQVLFKLYANITTV